MTPLTKRSFQLNSEIATYVNAVRKVLESIKEDCGVQAVTTKNKDEPEDRIGVNSILENDDFGNEVPLKRLRRKRCLISISHEIPSSGKKVAQDIVPDTSSIAVKDIGKKTYSHEPMRGSCNISLTKEVEAPLVENTEISMQSEQIYVEKVANWLDKNGKLGTIQLTSNDCDPEMSVENNLISTHIFDPSSVDSFNTEKSISTNKIHEELCKQAVMPEVDSHPKNSSKNIDTIEESSDRATSNVHQDKIFALEIGKENKCITSNAEESKRCSNRGKKCILSEINESEGRTSLKSNKMLREVSGDISEIKPCLKEPKNVTNMNHNVRFASEVKTKLLDCTLAKPTKLKRCSKAKKSPGWSRVEGARMDLRSNRSNVVIKGRAQRGSCNTSTLSSNLPESTQESQVVIENIESPTTEQVNSNKSPKNIEEESSCEKADSCHTHIDSRDHTKLRDVIINKGSDLSNSNTLPCEQSKVDVIENVGKSSVRFENEEEGQIGNRGEIDCQFNGSSQEGGHLVVADLVGNSKNNVNIIKGISSSLRDAVPKSSTLSKTKLKGKLSRRIPKAKATSNLLKPRDSNDNMDVDMILPAVSTSGVSHSLNVDTDKCNDSVSSEKHRATQDIAAINPEVIKTNCNSPDRGRSVSQDSSFKLHNRGESCKNDTCTIQSPRSSVPFTFFCTQNSKRLHSFDEIPCHHSIPCELYSVLHKFSSYLMSNPCSRVLTKRSIATQHSSFLSLETSSMEQHGKGSVTGESVRQLDSEIIPETNLSPYEVVPILPLPALPFDADIKSQDDHVNDKIEIEYNDAGTYEDHNSFQASKICPLKDSGDSLFTGVKNVSSVNLSTTQGTSCSFADTVKVTSLSNLEANSLDSVNENQMIPHSGSKRSITQSSSSGEVTNKNVAESPIKIKRSRRMKVLSNSSSDSDDELNNTYRKRISRKKDCSVINSEDEFESHSRNTEEFRDFNRYDTNIWKHFKNSNFERDEIGVNEKRSEIADEEKSSETEPYFDEDDDDVIPGTEEVLKNVQSDLDMVNKLEDNDKSQRSSLKNSNFTPSISSKFNRGLDDSTTFSQDSLLSASTRNLLRKCDQSLLAAKSTLNAKSVPAFAKPLNISKGLSNFDNKVDGDMNNDRDQSLSSHHSVIFSQNKNKQNSAEELKKEILLLEQEVENKKMKLEIEMGTTNNATAFNLERNSDNESEELFDSQPKPFTSDEPLQSVNSRDPKDNKEMVVICTGLNQEDISRVNGFVQNFGGSNAKFESFWTPRTTHVVVRTDEENLSERTIKYLYGVASKSWVISFNWVKDSIRMKKIMPENNYFALDCTGAPGPLRWKELSCPPLESCQFFLIPPFEDITVKQMSELIEMCGGRVVSRFNEKVMGLKLYITNGPEQGDQSGSNVSFSGIRRRNKITVTRDWLLECIGMCSMVSLSSYIVGTPTEKEISASCVPGNLMIETQEF